MVLTDEGRNVLEYANRFMRIEDEFITSLKGSGDISGELNIHAPNTICVHHLPKLLTSFKAEHSRVNFKLRAHYSTRRAFKELRSGAIDLMIVLEEEFDKSDFNVEVLRPEEIIVVCNNKHPLVGKKNVMLDDLKDQNFILTEPTCGYREIFTREMLKRGHKLVPNMWFENTEAIKQCVISNMGLSFLPKVACQADIACGALSRVNLDQKFDDLIKLQIITHKDKWISPALKAFITALKNTYC